ncbi:MAG: hypothetical protein CYPHOPRED_004380 [Cyphobasidiales sp. Tagirdzhanova-0007]|nr:MAG: hypothetical protein CYPHOPRED_004380 [Cyphobasidiales sp. Tagirdzhanova-0007]
MENSVKELAQKLVQRAKLLPDGERLLVGIAGVPGAGKSTIAYPLVELVNNMLGVHVQQHTDVDIDQGLASPAPNEPGQITISVSLDGWHTARVDLDKMPNPAEAHRRRGAAFTFDAVEYVSFVSALREKPFPSSIPFRTFSHGKKDPEISAQPIEPHHRIIIIEGLYVLLDTEPWNHSTAMLDERIWVECPDELARERLIKRHLLTGIETNQTAAEARVDGSDMINGQFIRDYLVKPTCIVNSVVDVKYVQSIEDLVELQPKIRETQIHHDMS